MTKHNKRDQFIRRAKDVFFQYVGFKGFDQRFIDTNPKNWQQKRCWTEKNELRFRRWFQMEIQKELKIDAVSAAAELFWFILHYNWKTIDKTAQNP